MTIDRVELHAASPPAPEPAPRAQLRAPAMSLDRYLTMRAEDDA